MVIIHFLVEQTAMAGLKRLLIFIKYWFRSRAVPPRQLRMVTIRAPNAVVKPGGQGDNRDSVSQNRGNSITQTGKFLAQATTLGVVPPA
jgi:hypothetical protein